MGLIAVAAAAAYLAFVPAGAGVVRTIEHNIAEVVAQAGFRADRFRETRSLSLLDTSGETAFFLFSGGDPVYWSTNKYMPDLKWLPNPAVFAHYRSGGGDYLARSWSLGGDTTLVLVIPLSRRFKITNAYLQPWQNESIFGNTDVAVVEPGVVTGRPVTLDGHTMFRVQPNPTSQIRTVPAAVSTVAILLATIMFAWILIIRIRTALKSFPDLVFVVAAGFVALVRLVMILVDFPHLFLNIHLFDPAYFASSELNPSLGDLLINSIAVAALCVLLLNDYIRFRSFRWFLIHRGWRDLLGLFSALAVFFAVLFPFIVVQTIYNNSSITLSITDTIDFDGLRLTAIASVLLCCISAFLFVHVFSRLLFYRQKKPWRVAIHSAGGLITFLLINEMSGQRYETAAALGAVYLLVLGLFRLRPSFFRFTYPTFAYLIGAIVLFSVVTSLAIRYFVVKERTADQVRFANNYLADRDYLAEYLINDARARIEQDAFIQSRLSAPYLGKEAIRDKIRQVFLPAYLDRYLVEIHVYNASGQPWDDPEGFELSQRMARYNRRGDEAEYPGLYYVATPTPVLTQRYAAVSRVARADVVAGYVVIEFSLKKYIPESVYPELLVDNRFQQNFRSQDFSYAVISGKDVLMRYGSFGYERLALADLDRHLEDGTKGFEDFGYRHVVVREGSGNLAVVSTRTDPVLYGFADFSFQFVQGLFVMMMALLVIGIRTRFENKNLFLSARIQLLLNLAFLIPLLAVSIITVTLVSVSFRDQLNDEYMSKARSFADQLNQLLTREDTTVSAANQLASWSRLANVDANLYSQKGRLIATSQSEIFENQILTAYMHPDARARLHQSESNFITTEEVGSLHYAMAYANLRSPQTGASLGVLGIPFFQSGSALERIQISILANMLTIFSMIILLLSVVFFFVSGWLTYPLILITQLLGKMSLTGLNQPLQWRSDDEIGMLVNQYNAMLVNLQHNMSELERSQREHAWREIAQQVAHEIRNPLTPMKLKLQQLERSVGKDRIDQIQQTVVSLLGQVEMLNDIAASFSAFAKMPELKMGKVNLWSLLRRTMDLHKSAGAITLKIENEIRVRGDEQLLERIFSNLILNALQAEREDVPVHVELSVKQSMEFCSVIVKDNGRGMTEEIRNRVFLPHFSTKQSGSGLGLAIAKQGIEQMGGTITFESEVGKGTVFIIGLPLIRE